MGWGYQPASLPCWEQPLSGLTAATALPVAKGTVLVQHFVLWIGAAAHVCKVWIMGIYIVCFVLRDYLWSLFEEEHLFHKNRCDFLNGCLFILSICLFFTSLLYAMFSLIRSPQNCSVRKYHHFHPLVCWEICMWYLSLKKQHFSVVVHVTFMLNCTYYFAAVAHFFLFCRSCVGCLLVFEMISLIFQANEASVNMLALWNAFACQSWGEPHLWNGWSSSSRSQR